MDKKGLSGLLFYALLFFILALVAAVFGFGLIAGLSFVIAKWMVIIFVILLIVSLIAHAVKAA
jgi:uncharacterized membrane protein YtjA (UPF0391 family)